MSDYNAPVPEPVRFLGLTEAQTRYDLCRAVVLPIPFERTVSYGPGTAGGPAALLQASTQVELYDEVLGTEPWETLAPHTLSPLDDLPEDLAEALERIEAKVRRHLEAGKFVASIGGEHSLTTAPVRAARTVHGKIGVVQFDAHADLRDSYEGTPYSHACVMRRVVEMGCPTLAVGIRALAAPEGELIRNRRLPTVWGHELAALTVERFSQLVDALPPKVYLTFDVDYFDPAIMPSTGTPEPGGGLWYATLALLAELFRRREVVAMDIVELAPVPGSPASDFLAARLLYKCLGYFDVSSH
ncbi:MAG: agmatinase [Thermoanaerobaculia bacterium]